jgi:hypothetical protein
MRGAIIQKATRALLTPKCEFTYQGMAVGKLSRGSGGDS